MKVVCLLSGGIDSPVAAYMMAERGVGLILLHLDITPEGEDGGLDKMIDMAREIERAAGTMVQLLVAPYWRNQRKITEGCGRGYQCVLCKRLMLRIARRVCDLTGSDAIVTGESLGQVASQTLHNIRAEEHGLDFLVLRPLIGLDKLEIEAIAKRIGTYDISIVSVSPCRIVPRKPATMAGTSRIEQECRNVDIDEMTEYAVSNLKELKLG